MTTQASPRSISALHASELENSVKRVYSLHPREHLQHPSAMRITLIGGPTALLEIEEYRLLTDPTFDPPGSESKERSGYAA